MKQSLTKMLLSLGLVTVSFSAYAVPAYTGLITVTQPDGSEVQMTLRGDENFNWAVSPDGYTLLRNAENCWVFAKEDTSGDLIPSDIIYRGNSGEARANGIKQGLMIKKSHEISPKQQMSVLSTTKSDLQVEGTFPPKGKNKLLMLMLNYSDTEPTYTQTQFENLMNQEGYSSVGSFRDFYLENSYGQLDITTTVTRWVTLPYAKSYYGSDRAIEMIQHGLNILDAELDLSEFDNDGDGVLDGLAVIHQGAGQEYTGAANDIWSHSSVIYGMSFDGIQVRRYTIEPELLGMTGKMSTIGVICHEFGHNLGAPDFYDTDYSGNGGDYSGTGLWDLMGSGAWNGSSGDRPAHINMWQKIQLGWVNPIMLDSSVQVSSMPPAYNNAVAYRFDTTVPGEYFIMENRQQEGAFDQAIPGHGLIIYHANESMIRSSVADNTLNVTYPQAMYPLCASAGCDPSSYVSSYGDVNSASAPFPGTRNVTVLNDASQPSTRSISGRYSYKALTNITEDADGNISFNFTAEETPASPVNLTATAERGIVTLKWKMPADATANVMHYNIYRNEENIAFTQMNEFTDRGLSDEALITYYVDAVYTNGLVSPYASVSIRIPSNIVADISATAGDADVELAWNLDSRLTRMTDIDATHNISNYNVSELDYVHRFRADDLKMYAGYGIRRIAFLPYQPQKDITFTLRVWEADADGKNAKIISERVVKEYGTAIWNTVLLTKSVTITGEKELWIGLNCKSNTGNIQLLSDIGPVVDGYGNWIRLEGEDWKADNVAPGNYFLYVPLTEPEAGAYSELLDCGVIEDVALDLFYPMGFAVYRDDVLLGWTSSRKFIDNAPLKGTHVYSITSLFKGRNESAAKPVEVTFGIDGINHIEQAKVKVIINENRLSIANYHGDMYITDIAGRVIYNDYYEEEYCIELQSGIYIIKLIDETIKVIIR